MLIKWMLLVLVRVKTPVLASIREKYIKKEQFTVLKDVKWTNTANYIEKSAHNYYCMEFPWLQVVIFAYFSYSGDVLSILSTMLPFLCCGDKRMFWMWFVLFGPKGTNCKPGMPLSEHSQFHLLGSTVKGGPQPTSTITRENKRWLTKLPKALK